MSAQRVRLRQVLGGLFGIMGVSLGARALAAGAGDPAGVVSLGALVDSDRLSDVPGNDSVCLKSEANPKGRARVEIPIARGGEALTVRWWLEGTQEKGAAALVKLELADGTKLETVAEVGDAVSSPPVATGRSVVVRLGLDAQGQERWGNAWTLPIGRDVEVTRLTLSARARATLCVSGVSVGDSPLTLTPRVLPDATPFVMARNIQPIPSALPVEAPAGRRGMVRLDGDGHFQYSDGTRARFWGINLVSRAAIPEKADADAFAATLAGLGFNMVRLHHIDHPAPAGVVAADRKPGQSPFDADQLDKLDYFVSRLLAHGLYLWLEVATAREFTAADGVLIPDSLPNGHKLGPMWEPDRADAYDRWFEQIWGRTNPHTGRRYADEPGVAVLELSNEHELTAAWGFGLEHLAPAHLAALDARWNVWLKERYRDDAALAAAWTGSVNPGLAAGEGLATGTVRREPMVPQLAGRWPRARRDDLLAFYRQIQEDWYTRVAEKARSLGFKVPIVPTFQYNKPYAQAATLEMTERWAKTGLDGRISDIHIAIGKAQDGEREDQSSLVDPRSLFGFLTAQVAGTAACASELNHTWPNAWRAEGGPLFAALAAVQDWDALVWFSWADGGLVDDPATLNGSFDLRTNPALLAHLPSASAAFRGGVIPAAPGYAPVSFDQEGVFAADPGAAPRPLELMDPAFVLGHRVRTSIAATPVSPVAGVADGSVGWWPGLLVVDRPGYQVRVGPPGVPSGPGVGPSAPSGLRVSLDRWAVVSFAADDQKGALLTVSARQENTGMAMAAQGRVRAADGTAPVMLEGVRGTVSFPWKKKPTVTLLDRAGKPTTTIPVEADGKGWWKVTLDGVVGVWMQVR